jgi:DNA-binding CsgD family transcriptional regulator
VSAWLPRVCFLAKKYGLTPREVTLIALISSGKSGRAISQTLGIGMPTIRKYCCIHDKIGTHSRLEIGLWAIREGMVKSAVQSESDCRVQDPLQAVSAMTSKLLQKKSCGVKQSGDVVGGQQENIEDSPVPWPGRETGVLRCAPTMCAKGTASSNGRPQKGGPGPEACRIRPRPVMLA